VLVAVGPIVDETGAFLEVDPALPISDAGTALAVTVTAVSRDGIEGDERAGSAAYSFALFSFERTAPTGIESER